MGDGQLENPLLHLGLHGVVQPLADLVLLGEVLLKRKFAKTILGNDEEQDELLRLQGFENVDKEVLLDGVLHGDGHLEAIGRIPKESQGVDGAKLRTDGLGVGAVVRQLNVHQLLERRFQQLRDSYVSE